jgi:hypothetical protein
MKLEKYKVNWIHNKKEGTTTCVIKKWETKVWESKDLVGVGVSLKHPNDSYNKAVGRKVSLGKAMWVAGFPKEKRKKIWSEYFKQVKGNINVN